MSLQSSNHVPEYRADIDGLRAISVISVVLYHAFPGWMKGGFIGVDVFFVISGFLITSILLRGVEQGNFSFFDFYARRIRRIFPALIVVLVFVYLWAWFFLLPDEFRILGKSMVASAAFVSNFLSWHEVGYFDALGEEKPLLHLWSLGVEEQFYIAWPLLLSLVFRRARLLLWTIVVLALASFAINVMLVHGNGATAFYLPHARLWELLSGSLLAWVSWTGLAQRLTSRRKWLIHVSSWIGGSILVLGFWCIDKEVAFPGWAALLPVAGTVLLIGAGPQAWLSQHLLSRPFMVWIGLLSFPLYLWHWPLLSFVRIIHGEDSPFWLRCMAVIFSLALAWLTYRCFEMRVRRSRAYHTVAVLCMAMLCTGLAGYIAYEKEGFPSRRFFDNVIYKGDVGHSEYFARLQSEYPVCMDDEVRKSSLVFEGVIRCRQSKNDYAVDLVLLGDSHAEHLFMGVAEALPDRNVAFYIRDNPFQPGALDSVMEAIERSTSIKKVVIALYWAWRMDQVPEGSSLAKEILKISRRLQDAGKDVYLVDDVPRYSFDPKNCGHRRAFSRKQLQCEIAKADMEKDYSKFLGEMKKSLELNRELQLFEIRDYLCEGTQCSMQMGGQLLYRDMNHLNIPGSIYVGRKLVEEHRGLLQDF